MTDIVTRAAPSLRAEPLAVVEARSGGVRVAAANGAAREGGVSRGMTLTEARARLPGLLARSLAPSAVDEALAQLGDWAHRFGPAVGVIPAEEERPPAVAVEVGGSAHLFGGEGALAGRALAALSRAGYGAVAAVASTLGAAFAAAGYGSPSPSQVVPPGEEARALAALPLEALRLPVEAARRLRRVGVKTVEALLALPRPSVARRFGAGVLRRLAETLGEVAEPLPRHVPRSTFQGRIELPDPDDRPEAILWALGRLLDDAGAWLLARGEGARRLAATLEGEEGARTEVEVALGEPRRDRRRLERLFRARLEQVPSPGRLTAVALAVLETGLLRSRQAALLAGTSDAAADAIEDLLERLAARLGERAVLRPLLADDARPERAAKLAFAVQGRGSAILSGPRRPGDPPSGGPGREPGPRSRAPPLAMRPVRLLSAPRPAPAPARILRGPERIVCGWWDGDIEARDYHVVEDALGRRLWAYRAGGEWLVHGVF